MNRIFHARISRLNYLYLFILGGVSFFMLWEKHIIVAVVVMLFLVVMIERVIHTTYTITTEGMLLISFGRFAKVKSIPLSSITHIERIETMKIGSFHLTSYLLINHAGGHTALMPVKEEEFIARLQKKD